MSIGLVSTPRGLATLSELLRIADVRLYEAKRGGRSMLVVR